MVEVLYCFTSKFGPTGPACLTAPTAHSMVFTVWCSQYDMVVLVLMVTVWYGRSTDPPCWEDVVTWEVGQEGALW